MEFPESYRACDSTHLDLGSESEREGCPEVVSSEISVLWASALLTNSHLSDNELLHIARSMGRSEYSRTSVKLTFLRPLCVCRIYPNGRILIMGALTEKQAYARLAKTVRRIRYRTKWKVQIPTLDQGEPPSSHDCRASGDGAEAARPSSPLEGPDSTPERRGASGVEGGAPWQAEPGPGAQQAKRRRLDGNGLTWRYVENERIFRVSEALATFKIDQLFCRVVLAGELNLAEIYHKLDPRTVNVNQFGNYLRFQFTLGAPEGSDSAPPAAVALPSALLQEDLDIGLELERALDTEMGAPGRTRSCLVFKSGKISILGCVDRAEIADTFSQLMRLL